MSCFSTVVATSAHAGLTKNTPHVIPLFALSNRWMARRILIAMQEKVRPKAA